MTDANTPAEFSPAPVPQKRKRSFWFWLLVGGGSVTVLVLFFAGILWLMVGSGFNDDGFSSISSNKIAVVDIDGVILSADKTDEQLRKFADDDSVKAIILHINSPGGGAAASQEIYHEVMRLREKTRKPIVASVESVGASGAYYIASACNKIYANDASVVGSIGVIMEWVNYGDLLRWAKLKQITLKAGELKDAGSPTRDLTPKEQAYFQGLVDNMHGQFIHDVSLGRHLPDTKIAPLATGQVWTGQQALPLGLIDRIGGFRVALIDTARSVGISGEPIVVRPARPRIGLLDILTGSPDSDSLFPNPGKLLEQNAGFYFLWK
jgi:protease-4